MPRPRVVFEAFDRLVESRDQYGHRLDVLVGPLRKDPGDPASAVRAVRNEHLEALRRRADFSGDTALGIWDALDETLFAHCSDLAVDRRDVEPKRIGKLFETQRVIEFQPYQNEVCGAVELLIGSIFRGCEVVPREQRQFVLESGEYGESLRGSW